MRDGIKTNVLLLIFQMKMVLSWILITSTKLMRWGYISLTFGVSQRWGEKQTKNILVKTCSPYITKNFLYLLNATKSKIIVLNTIWEMSKGKFRWNQIFNIYDAEWEQFFSLLFRLTKDTQLQWFQWFHFRINHKILSKNSFLHKIKLKDTNIWIICRRETETIEHILSDCE